MGWIKVDRDIQQCSFWNKEKFSFGQALIDLMFLANYEDKKVYFCGELITLEKGQFITSVRFLKERWMWHNNEKVLKFLNDLETQKIISKKSTKNGTLISLENTVFDSDSENTDRNTNGNTDRNSSRNTDRNKDKNKRNKNTRTKEKDIHARETYFDNPKINDAFVAFVEHRKEIKKPMSERAITIAVNRIREYAALPFSDELDEDVAVQTIENSIMNGWQGIFPSGIKTKKSGGNNEEMGEDLKNAIGISL